MVSNLQIAPSFLLHRLILSFRSSLSTTSYANFQQANHVDLKIPVLAQKTFLTSKTVLHLLPDFSNHLPLPPRPLAQVLKMCLPCWTDIILEEERPKKKDILFWDSRLRAWVNVDARKVPAVSILFPCSASSIPSIFLLSRSTLILLPDSYFLDSAESHSPFLDVFFLRRVNISLAYFDPSSSSTNFNLSRINDRTAQFYHPS